LVVVLLGFVLVVVFLLVVFLLVVRIMCCSNMAQGELCSSETVCARAIAGETFNLVWQSATFLQLVSSKDIDYRMEDHFNRWIRRDAHEFFAPTDL
jgi:hypothetical protein